MNVDRIERAAAFARARHQDQVRKGPHAIPYVTHCEEVAMLTEKHGGTEAAIAAAWLHDVVEDTVTKLSEIEALFGKDVADIVSEVTDDPSPSKEAVWEAQISGAPNKSPMAAIVKASDQTSNMISIVETPPYWTRGKALAYITKARAVVEGLKAPDALKDEFRNAADKAELKALGFPEEDAKQEP